jgi:hypothetical protein
MKKLMLVCAALSLALAACHYYNCPTSQCTPPMSQSDIQLYRAEHKGNNPPSTFVR